MNIKNIRKANKISQTQLAGKLKVDQSTISKWEKGISSPSIQTLKKISEVLECSVDELIKDEKEGI